MGSIAESDTTEQLTQHKLFSHIFKRYSKYWEHSREREKAQRWHLIRRGKIQGREKKMTPLGLTRLEGSDGTC